MRNRPLLFLLPLLLLLSGCGYRFVNQGFRDLEVSVPYIEGDLDGAFTAAVVHQVSTRNAFVYSTCGGTHSLRICLMEPKLENIGFRFAPDKQGAISKITAATEARLTARAKVSLIECSTGRVLLGPVEVFSYLDYDFESDFSNVNLHAFSLGQLEMNQQASDNTYARLNDLLAQKIVDYVEGSW